MHISELNIKSYRGLCDLEVTNLGNINIIVGENNAGKTSLLEAIQLFCEPSEYGLVKIANQRNTFGGKLDVNLDFMDSLQYLSHHAHSSETWQVEMDGLVSGKEAKFSITGEISEALVVNNHKENEPFYYDEEKKNFNKPIDAIFALKGELKYSNNGILADDQLFLNERRNLIKKDFNLPTVTFLSTIDHIAKNPVEYLSQSKKHKEKAISLLKNYDNSIQNIHIIQKGCKSIPMLETQSDEYIPLVLFGDGMKKALSLLNALIPTENGILLIDEFETALHTSIMKEIFQFTIETAKELNIQLFLTTHSMEAVDKLLEASGVFLDTMRVIRLKQTDKKTYARVTEGEKALEFRENYGMELRE